MKKSTFLAAIFSVLTISSFAQEEKELRKELNAERPKYLEIGYGNSFTSFRDLATGPLYYTGLGLNVNVHYHRFDSLKETRMGVRYLSGKYSFEVSDETAESGLNSITAEYGKLYHLSRLSNEKYNVKVGGLATITGNLRLDPTLQNASVGYELIYNFMASAKVSRDVSRKTSKSGKFLFIKYNREPRKRLLSYRLNVGVINSNVRNGYAYVNQRQIENRSFFFGDYEHNFFNGFRMSSSLFYTIYLHNENALRFSYVWDAYRTNEDYGHLELANHLFSVAFLFDLQNF